MKGLLTFLAGAAVGAVATALLTPTTGEDLRARIKVILQRKGLIAADDMDDLVEMIATEVEQNKKLK
ncbi:MAG: YtxH domain-containing protein [Muribaculaceae bacterium]|nr:YtxH domain-containing protein [Muribaculaceae bacterium]